MAELLHYLDKMEYRPEPKPKERIVLKRRPDREIGTHEEMRVDIFDKRPVSGFKRVVIKEFERMIGHVQERKRKRGQGSIGDQEPNIYLEVTELATDDFVVPLPPGEYPEEEPETPEDVSKALDERWEEMDEEDYNHAIDKQAGWATHALRNICSKGTVNQAEDLVEQGAVSALCSAT